MQYKIIFKQISIDLLLRILLPFLNLMFSFHPYYI